MKSAFTCLLALVITMTFSACALFPNWHWEKRGATEADYAIDERDCKVLSYSGTDVMVTQVSVRRMHSCLEMRGWRKVKN